MKSLYESSVIIEMQSRAAQFGLNAATIRAERILNWGGFSAHSFTVSDGERTIHLKLAADQADMRRWLAVHDHLEQHYRAPRILAWVDIPGTPLGGLAFEHIAGATWDIAARPELLGDLHALLERLHRDQPLANRLGGTRTYRECWELRYRNQFEEDIRTIRECRPSFVTDDRLRWMERESRTVLAIPTAHPAFEGTTCAPCHWDLWRNNVMVEPDGAWWVLDWDDLAIGDEAEDLATLVFPFLTAPTQDWREWLPGASEGHFATRLDLHLRAITLDYLIDVLADWADCTMPEWQDEVRPQKEALHHEFWDRYHSRWG